MAEAVISTIGRDRPGLVNELSALVHGHGLNIADSRMTVLGGEFAVLMSVRGTDAELDAFAAELEQVATAQGLAHLFRRTTPRGNIDAIPYEVRVVALDHPGIVRRIAGFFSQQGVNIRDLTTRASHAAHTGTPIFDLTMIVELPTRSSGRAMREQFEDFCRGEDLAGEMQPLR
jgi:glycine cleavage system transcriptional repressor